MKFCVKRKVELDAKFLAVDAGVRYWEDSSINGVEDTDGTLVPFRDGERWVPVINIDSGKIENWPEGTTAEIHYKICDDGIYTLKDEGGEEIAKIENEYVPRMLNTESSPDGDYIIMSILRDGTIENFKADLDAFENEEN